MTQSERIAVEIESLKPHEQAEVLDFVSFLKNRAVRREEERLKDFSLESAMRGMENEPDIYDSSDIREPIR